MNSFGLENFDAKEQHFITINDDLDKILFENKRIFAKVLDNMRT